MSSHTTFKIGGEALIVSPYNIESVAPLLSHIKVEGEDFIILGGGSNLLVADSGLKEIVVSLKEGCNKITVDGRRVTAEAGVSMATLAATCKRSGLSGLEFAAGIPGTVGGGLYMNAGAYGGEMADTLVSADLLNSEYRKYCADAAGLEMSYRHTNLMDNGGIVLSATFELTEGDPDNIAATMADLAARRRDKQPLDLPSAGSAFKRPQGDYAARLIEAAGLKGYKIGSAAVSDKHSGFIVNLGGATASDVRALMDHVRKQVESKFGITLEAEVRLVGF